jgi:hypothetical protein
MIPEYGYTKLTNCHFQKLQPHLNVANEGALAKPNLRDNAHLISVEMQSRHWGNRHKMRL